MEATDGNTPGGEPEARTPQEVLDGLDALLAEIEAKRQARHDPTAIKPGNRNAAAAYRAGCEDEYSNRMAYRYGGEW